MSVIWWMAVLTVLVGAQKLLPARPGVGVPLGLAVAGLGVLILAAPSFVPGHLPRCERVNAGARDRNTASHGGLTRAGPRDGDPGCGQIGAGRVEQLHLDRHGRPAADGPLFVALFLIHQRLQGRVDQAQATVSHLGRTVEDASSEFRQSIDELGERFTSVDSDRQNHAERTVAAAWAERVSARDA